MTTHPQDHITQARSVAAWLLAESHARRIDPITEIYTELDEVRLVVCPTAEDVWATWCHLLAVDEESVKWGRGMVTATGRWAATTVRLRGLDTERWAGR